MQLVCMLQSISLVEAGHGNAACGPNAIEMNLDSTLFLANKHGFYLLVMYLLCGMTAYETAADKMCLGGVLAYGVRCGAHVKCFFGM